jgi:NTE family protein
MVKQPKYNIGIVLSGGAARGFTHLGVLKALEEFGMKPDIISGVSAGAIAGALYADGYPPEEIMQIYTRKSIFEFMQMTVPKTGFFKPTGLKETLLKNLRAKRFEQLQIPLVVTATNLLAGKSEYFREGSLVDAILASACVPIVFEAVMINKVPYIDGGIMNNLPVEPILDECRRLIGVYIIPTGEIDQLKGMIHIAERSFHLAVASETRPKHHLFDIFIEPAEISKYSMIDLKRAPELFALGYSRTVEILKESKGTMDKQKAG